MTSSTRQSRSGRESVFRDNFSERGAEACRIANIDAAAKSLETLAEFYSSSALHLSRGKIFSQAVCSTTSCG